MSTPRVLFVTLPPSPVQPDTFPHLNSFEYVDPTPDPNGVEAILDNLLITSDRLAIAEIPIAEGVHSDTFFAKLDESSETPRDVAVKHFLRPDFLIDKDSHPKRASQIAEALKVRERLKHPNVLELLGCSINRSGEIYRLISPYMIYGNIRDYLARAPVGVVQRLGFVRDVTAGLDYLHSQSPPICHGNLNTDVGELQVFHSIINRQAPGRAKILLDLVRNAPKPEYASTLRLLHSYLPLCWAYEPRKRPPISLLRRQAFMFSFVQEAGDSVVAKLEELAHLLISSHRLRVIERSELGVGNYGEVVLGTLDETSPTPRDVAVKKLKAAGTRVGRVRLAKRLARELNVWAKVRHPNVVELIGYYLDEKYEGPLLISALMPNGNVLEYIERFKPLLKQRNELVKGITAGLACLHNFDPPICHGDLKPANVLIDLHMNAVLCDFGLASFVGSVTSPELVTTTTLKGTPRYMSPELYLDGDCTHSLESDVWAWACTVFQVLTGSFPYVEAPGEAQLCMAIFKKQPPCDINLLLPNNFGDADSESLLALQLLHSTLPSCWDFEPQRRPSMCNLLSQISDLSSGTVLAASRNENVSSNSSGSKESASLLQASHSPSRGCTDGGKGAQDAGCLAAPAGIASGNCLKRKRAGSYSFGDPDPDDGDRRVRLRAEGSSDGRTRAREEEREGCNTLKVQLLALADAIDKGAEMVEGRAPHESLTWIRKALGDKWESQLATVLQDIDRHKENGGIMTRPMNSDEGRASQHTEDFQLQSRRSSQTGAEDPDFKLMEN